jgi:hypothetical protein
MVTSRSLTLSFAEDKAKDYTREQWEAALDKAKERTEPQGWPLIITDDFF